MNEICVICNLERSKDVYVFWKPNFTGYTSDPNEIGQYNRNDICKKYNFPFVIDKYNLTKCLIQKVDNIIIPITYLEKVLEKPQLVFLKNGGYNE